MSDHEARTIAPEVIESLRAFLLTLLLAPFLAAAGSPADSSAGLQSWTIVAGDERTQIQAKDAAAASDSVLISLRQEGHYFARVDSIDDEATSGGRIYVTPGLRYLIHEIDISGATSFEERELRLLLKSRPGAVLDPALLEEDVRVLLDQYEGTGHPRVRRNQRGGACPGRARGTAGPSGGGRGHCTGSSGRSG